MSALPEYDEEAEMQKTIERIHLEWEELRGELTSGQKAWLTQIRKFYARLVKADPEAAIEMLARHEYVFDQLRKQGISLSAYKKGTRLSDFIDFKPNSPA